MKTIAAVMFCLLFAATAQAHPFYGNPVYLTDANGRWIGANNVRVFNTATFGKWTEWDIRFADGTCTEVFGACDQAHLPFHDLDTAHAANSALGALQGLGPFAYHPELIEGCGPVAISWFDRCIVTTPFWDE